jgi:16S rRNA (guanine527-N7)-methyltransferase
MMDKIAKYHDLLTEWSPRINLISKGDLARWVKRHFLDSLTPLALIPEKGDLIDIGSGAGFPGIPLALCRARVHFTLLESNHKKVLFLRAAKRELNLENVNILEGRVERMEPRSYFNLATIRALPKWERMLPSIHEILRPAGTIIYYEKRGICRIIGA